MSSVSFHFSDSDSPHPPADSSFGPNNQIVFVGKASVLSEHLGWLINSFVQVKTGEHEWLQPLLASLLESTSVSDFTGGSSHTSLAATDGSSFRVGFIVIPTVSSRHNSPIRPDTVYEQAPEFLKSRNASTSSLSRFVFVIDNNDNCLSSQTLFGYAVSLAAGLGRAAPSYSRKKASENNKHVVAWASFFSSSSMKEASPQPILTEKLAKHLEFTVQGVRDTASLVDQPTNELNTSAFVAAARSAVQELIDSDAFPHLTADSLKINVIEGKELDEQGFGGIFGVGKAALHPPALVIMSYLPADASETLAWVGKGIVYDTGGLSIKTSEFMPGMKRDMGGAAAIFEAFLVSAKVGTKKRLHALLCLAENSVGPLATRPGTTGNPTDDIHTLYSGLTVEINNTDAEGRLVLSDGVSYAVKHLKPDVLLDMCTLTGAQGISTGKKHASIVCNDDDLEHQAVQAGKISGDLVHPLLYCPEFFTPEFTSAVADMKNSVKDRANAQSSCAAQFIANHIKEYTKAWLHVDMAYPVHKGERATGYGVLLLLQLFVWPDLWI